MKSKIYSLIAILALSISLTACGGGAAGVAADAKADFTISAAEFATKTKENPAPYLDKIIEVSGKVTKYHEVASGGDTEHGGFYIHIEYEGDMKPTITCYFNDKQEGLEGKEVTVKGKCAKYEIADACFLRDCVVVK
jgi:tRNA_anti-like